ncbi:hypothetical protein GCM10012275_00430 [Longimycelium tulufanense]|uniref:Nuclear transport factor 2 family protein n=1 Tax=Longimycelium tulufanense TaxID=907463 RepID=A0A8J3FU90_9PSEU|nr:nuclear transport factor 2 family protein [Longimycelium tulufanense]GGM32978.1 hypothetical protein GCM10012275_00430 [Longimycelium tulufanense]
MRPESLSNPVVRRVIVAMRDGDRKSFLDAFALGAEMTDDGTSQQLQTWADREVFRSHGHLEVEREENDGLYLTGRYQSDQWDMPTYWRFEVEEDKITRMDVGAL